jgi:hypothetical protein
LQSLSVFDIHDNAEDFQGKEDMPANELLGDIIGNFLLFILCEDSSIWDANRDEGGIPSSSGIFLPKGPASAKPWTGKVLQHWNLGNVRKSVPRSPDGGSASSRACDDNQPGVIRTEAVLGH